MKKVHTVSSFDTYTGNTISVEHDVDESPGWLVLNCPHASIYLDPQDVDTLVYLLNLHKSGGVNPDSDTHKAFG